MVNSLYIYICVESQGVFADGEDSTIIDDSLTDLSAATAHTYTFQSGGTPGRTVVRVDDVFLGQDPGIPPQPQPPLTTTL